ncbi:MAG: hypothetical protein A2Y73_05895 [Chloroflexi bacterium RBG_13_56_8]|nr:MAG: hypothetical protein A2Y73_05895 [Chloroflexi bacterium RBG_13_56_8]
MELRDYFRIIAKRGWIIAVAMCITAVSALAFSWVQTPIYRSTIYLNVWSARTDWGLQQTIKMVMRNYALNIESRQTATEVINRLQLDITPDELREKLTISPIESDFVIQIDADDYDPLIARDIAQTTANVFVEFISEFMLEQDKGDRIEVNILDSALPGILHKPKWKINTLAGAAFGVLVGTMVVFILEWLESDIIRTAEDTERHTGMAVLGAIPSASGNASRAAHQGRSITSPITRQVRGR